MKLSLALFGLPLALLGRPAMAQGPLAQPPLVQPPVDAVRGVVEIVPFTVATPYPHAWHAEAAPVRQGQVVVLEVDPDVARPRQVDSFVLYVGAVPAARWSWHPSDEHLVVVVPGDVDLATTPVYWGSSTLPERVDAAHGAAEQAQALAAGARPLPGLAVAAARVRGGAARDLADQAAVHALCEALAAKWVSPVQP